MFNYRGWIVNFDELYCDELELIDVTPTNGKVGLFGSLSSLLLNVGLFSFFFLSNLVYRHFFQSKFQNQSGGWERGSGWNYIYKKSGPSQRFRTKYKNSKICFYPSFFVISWLFFCCCVVCHNLNISKMAPKQCRIAVVAPTHSTHCHTRMSRRYHPPLFLFGVIHSTT